MGGEKDMKPEDLAYIAGFFDGEGCISLTKYGDKRYHTHKWDSRLLKILLVNNNKDVLFWIRKRLKEESINFKVYPRFHFRKETYVRHFVGSLSNYPMMIKFLKLILPYLQIKKKKALEALKFLEERLPHCRKINREKVGLQKGEVMDV